MKAVPRRASKALVVLFTVLAIPLVGGPLVLAWSFVRLFIEIVWNRPEIIGTRFFFFGVLVPLLALLAFLVAEGVLAVLVLRWRERLNKMARVEARKLRDLISRVDR